MLFSFWFFLMLQQTGHKIRYAIMKWQNPQTLQCLKSENFFFFLQDRKHDFFLNDKHHKERAKKKKTRNVVSLSYIFLSCGRNYMYTDNTIWKIHIMSTLLRTSTSHTDPDERSDVNACLLQIGRRSSVVLAVHEWWGATLKDFRASSSLQWALVAPGEAWHGLYPQPVLPSQAGSCP